MLLTGAAIALGSAQAMAWCEPGSWEPARGTGDLSAADHAWITTDEFAKHRASLDLRQVDSRARMSVVRDAARQVLLFSYRAASRPLSDGQLGVLQAGSTPAGKAALQSGAVFPTARVNGQCLSQWRLPAADRLLVTATYRTEAGDEQRQFAFSKQGSAWLFDGLSE